MQLLPVNLFIVVTSLFFVTNPIPLSILGLFQLLICCWAIYKHSPVKLSLGIFFLVLLYFLHSGFGLLFLQGYSFNEIESRNIYSLRDYGFAQVFTELSILLYTEGYISKMKTGISKNYKRIEEVDSKYFWGFFFLCFPFYVASIVMTIDIARESGYVATYSETRATSLFHYGSILINACIPMAVLLLIINKKKVAICKFLAIIMLLLSVYSMTSGQRIIPITGLLALGIIYFNVVSRFSKRTILIISFFFVLLIVFMPMITALRTYGNVDVEHMAETYKEMKTIEEDGFMYNFIHEFGNTVISLIVPMTRTGESASYSFGLTYLFAPLSLSPKLPLDLVESDIYRDAMYFITRYPEAKVINFGGSILGESYANLGWLGICVFLLIGRLVKYVDYSINMARNGYVSYTSLLLIFIIPGLLRWTRDGILIVIGFIFIVLYFLWSFSLNKKHFNNLLS